MSGRRARDKHDLLTGETRADNERGTAEVRRLIEQELVGEEKELG